jgi:hypothetical protein
MVYRPNNKKQSLLAPAEPGPLINTNRKCCLILVLYSGAKRPLSVTFVNVTVSECYSLGDPFGLKDVWVPFSPGSICPARILKTNPLQNRLLFALLT